MILDLRELKRQNKTEEDFFFEYVPEENLCTIPETLILVPVRVHGKITLTGNHSAYVEGEVCFSVKGSCTRCLKECVNDYVFAFGEEVSDDPDGYMLKNDRVELAKIVDDTVVMNIPLNFLCSEDCKGICSGCGVNLNDGKCLCKDKEGK